MNSGPPLQSPLPPPPSLDPPSRPPPRPRSGSAVHCLKSEEITAQTAKLPCRRQNRPLPLPLRPPRGRTSPLHRYQTLPNPARAPPRHVPPRTTEALRILALPRLLSRRSLRLISLAAGGGGGGGRGATTSGDDDVYFQTGR